MRPRADEIFEAGLRKVFPEEVILPTKAYSMKQSPDGSTFWVAGIRGEIKEVLSVVSPREPRTANRQILPQLKTSMVVFEGSNRSATVAKVFRAVTVGTPSSFFESCA